MDSDENNEECLVEQLRKELHSLTWEEEETKKILKKNRYKNEEAKKERDEIKLILEKEEMEIAKKEEELKHFRARVQLRREKIQNMRQQIFINQMRNAEANEQIEELKKTLEEVKVKEKTDQKLLIDRLKAVQDKLLTASWVISRRKEKEELANLSKQIDEVHAKKERLLQSIQEKKAIFAESHELPFKTFCVAVATAALKNHALLKKLAQEYIIIAQDELDEYLPYVVAKATLTHTGDSNRSFFIDSENLINFQLTQELSNQGILDTSILSQYGQSQASQIQPFEEKVEESSACLSNDEDADENEDVGSFDSIREKNIDEMMNFEVDDKIHPDNQKDVNEPAMAMQILEDGKLNEDAKLIIINEETEKTVSNIAMETGENHEVRQICDELNANVGESEEGIIDTNEKQGALVDVNIDSSQISDKDNNIDSNFAVDFIDSSEEVEAAVSGENERNNFNDHKNLSGECESVPGINLKQMQSVSSDLDPTNFFESFTNFVPNLSTINMSSNTYLDMDTEFDASTIFNLSSVMQNQSGSITGANDYMALFGAVETNASSNGNEGFELNFDNLPDGNEVKKGLGNANSFFDF